MSEGQRPAPCDRAPLGTSESSVTARRAQGARSRTQRFDFPVRSYVRTSVVALSLLHCMFWHRLDTLLQPLSLVPNPPAPLPPRLDSTLVDVVLLEEERAFVVT